MAGAGSGDAVAQEAAAQAAVPAQAAEAQSCQGEDVPGPGKIKGSVINEDPKLVHFMDFISQAEVDHLLQLCEGRWERSLVSAGKASELHGAKGDNTNGVYGEEKVGETRTSCSVHLTYTESHVVERIAARVATVTGHPLENVEPLVVVRYEPGQYFKMHHDGAMRHSTVFVYLNSVQEGGGGETHFPHLGFQVQPAACTAVMWHNRLESGDADYRLKHEAKPIETGIKYGMNCFVNIHPQRDTKNIVLVHQADEDA